LKKEFHAETQRKTIKEKKKKKKISKWFHSFFRISLVLECDVGNSLRRRVFA